MIKVNLKFTNEKGQVKNVNFYMERKSYEMCLKLPEDIKNEYLLQEYREYCKECKHKRREITVTRFEKDKDEDNCFDIIDQIDLYEKETKEMYLKYLLSLLTEEEKQIIKSYFFMGKKKVEIANELNITEGAVRYKIKKALEKMKNGK